MTSTPPFFIIGNPRSGTSLLRSLVNTHAQVLVPPECGFILWLHAEWHDRSWSKTDLREFAEKVVASRKFETWQLDRGQVEDTLINSSVGSYADACAAIYEAYALSRGKAISCWGDKNNHYITGVARLKVIFPDARFIHIVRDVRDVACSYKELHEKNMDSAYRPRLGHQAADIANEWLKNNLVASEQMGDNPTKRIRYEDLVTDPIHIMAGVFEALDLPPIHGMSLTSHIDQYDEPTEFLQWKGKLVHPVNDSSIGRFRKELSLEEIAEIGSISAPLLIKYGYDL